MILVIGSRTDGRRASKGGQVVQVEMIEWTGFEDWEGCVVEGERGTKKDSWVSAPRIKGGGWGHFLGLVPDCDWAERLCPGLQSLQSSWLIGHPFHCPSGCLIERCQCLPWCGGTDWGSRYKNVSFCFKKLARW